MIIWNGLGILVVLIDAICISGISAIAGDDPNRTHNWPIAIGLLLSAIFVTIVGYYLRKQPGRTLIDPESGQKVIFKRNDSLFFIPVFYWGPINLLLAVFCMFTK